MTDLTFMAISVAVLCVGWRWCAGPEPKGSTKGWRDRESNNLWRDGLDNSCRWGTCDCVGKCEKKKEEKTDAYD